MERGLRVVGFDVVGAEVGGFGGGSYGVLGGEGGEGVGGVGVGVVVEGFDDDGGLVVFGDGVGFAGF